MLEVVTLEVILNYTQQCNLFDLHNTMLVGYFTSSENQIKQSAVQI